MTGMPAEVQLLHFLQQLPLLIAKSRPQEKDLMIKLIVNLINKRN